MRIRNRLTVTGTVQGVGFRPFVFQLASRNGIAGWVTNTSAGVIIEAEGEDSCVHAFLNGLREEAPRLAAIASVNIEHQKPNGDNAFLIRESSSSDRRIAMIPADSAMCECCANEVSDPDDRRFGYPFTNCTDCGPRFTIIRDIPYDRPSTTMASFDMCPECRREYHDPMNRRFHAQPNACPVCGPSVWMENGCESEGITSEQAPALLRAAEMLTDGHILAIKGLGGFHLACDASNEQAVRELRRRKGRGRKPFALMVRDIEVARRICKISEVEEHLLNSPERPIVLLEAKEGSEIAESVAPNNRNLGLMLPYTPLHRILFSTAPPILVMTSGNLSEEPIAHLNEDARDRLMHLADAFLMHNRDIHVPCDDSVVRAVLDEPLPIRRARGYVPCPIDLGFEMPTILACGAEQKSTFCLTVSRWAIQSQHIGDLDYVETLDYYSKAIAQFTQLFQAKPEIIAHDMHPDYLSTRYAETQTTSKRIPVQHHHAHVASCMAENHLTGPVIGVAFDGTGYGTDGNIWGGEFMVADLASFNRTAHLRYVPMPGGAAAIRQPSRMALAYLFDAFGDESRDIAAQVLGYQGSDLTVMLQQMKCRINSPLTSSMGRLFDAAGALLGLCRDATFEGESAVQLEAIASPNEQDTYPIEIYREDYCTVIDTRPLIRSLVIDILDRIPAPVASAKFHNTVTKIVEIVCLEIRNQWQLSDVVLSGGCFQNVRLLSSAVTRLSELGFSVHRHRLVPPNDGGISLGQAAIAAAVTKKMCSKDSAHPALDRSLANTWSVRCA